MSRVLVIKQLANAKFTPGMTVSEYFALFKDLETKAAHMNLRLGDVVLWFMLIGIEEYPRTCGSSSKSCPRRRICRARPSRTLSRTWSSES